MPRKKSNAIKNSRAHQSKKERRPNAQRPPLAMRYVEGDLPLPKGGRGKQLRKQVAALKRHLAAQQAS